MILDEIDGLRRARASSYVYFIDEIFLPDRALLEALVARTSSSACRLRIDSGRRDARPARARPAACPSRPASRASRRRAATSSPSAAACRPSSSPTRLIHAKQRVPFVQANLLESGTDDPAEVGALARSICSSTACGRTSPCRCSLTRARPTTRGGGARRTTRAWERAHDHYLAQFDEFSDIQDARPQPLARLELASPKSGLGGGPGAGYGSDMTGPEPAGTAERRPVRRVLMTADARRRRLAVRSSTSPRALQDRGIELLLAVMGPAARRGDQRRRRSGAAARRGRESWPPRVDGRSLAATSTRAGRVAPRPRARLPPDRRPPEWLLPCRAAVGAAGVVVAHSCVRSWWRAVHGPPRRPPWDRYSAEVARGLRRRRSWSRRPGPCSMRFATNTARLARRA